MAIPPATKSEQDLCITKIWYTLQRSELLNDVLDSYVSIMTMMLPTMRDSILYALNDAGFQIEEIDYKDHIPWEEETTVNEMGYVKHIQLLAAIGLFLIIPFKNSTTLNDNQYYTTWTNDLCGMLGLDPVEYGLILDVQQTQHIRARLNRSTSLKKLYIQFITHERTGDEPLLCTVLDYVWNNLSYTDMTPYHLILNTLVRTCSPVLFFPQMLPEVREFIHAAKTINSVQLPEFVRFLASREQLKVLERGKYPNLFAIALTIVSESVPSIKNMVGLCVVNKKLVETMGSVHRRYSKSTLIEPDVVNPDMLLLNCCFLEVVNFLLVCAHFGNLTTISLLFELLALIMKFSLFQLWWHYHTPRQILLRY